MKPLLLATQNAGKIAEMRPLLSAHFALTTLDEIAQTGSSVPAVEETGDTYQKNAWLKAEAYFQAFGHPVLADDSGLEIDVLGGAPGVYSARFGGLALAWPDRWNEVWKSLAPYPETAWTARFRSVLCYYQGKGRPEFFEGFVDGRILPSATGTSGFGYDPIFYCNELGKSFGEASSSEKLAISHRTKSLVAFLEWWKKHTGS